MLNGKTQQLTILINSLSQSEKRSFKLFVQRHSSGKETPKFVKLFDFIDQSKVYSDDKFLAKNKDIKKGQLSNLKSHLFSQIMSCLRVLNASGSIEFEFRQLLDHIQILYDKGLYELAIKSLERAKSLSLKSGKEITKLEILDIEKKIAAQYTPYGIENKAEELSNAAEIIVGNVTRVQEYSNLFLKLYGLYLKFGFAKNEKDIVFLHKYFYSQLPHYEENKLSFREKYFLYTAHIWYSYMVQDFLTCYRYAQKCVDLFDHDDRKYAESEWYIRSLNILLIALFNLRHYDKFTIVLKQLEQLENNILYSDNLKILHGFFLYTSIINKHFLEGSFSEGVENVKGVESFLQKHGNKIEEHRILVLYYKIGCLYFGSGDNKNAIKYLNKIIQSKQSELREDVHSFARILSLITHFELGNDELVEYQVKSVYRYLRKMDDLQEVQKAILEFIRKLPQVRPEDLKKAFIVLRENLIRIANNPYEKRPFLYLDIISWLESKIENKTVEEVAHKKFEMERKSGDSQYFPVKKG